MDLLHWASLAEWRALRWGRVDWINRWLSEQLDTPAGSLIIPLAMILVRCLVTTWLDRRERGKHRKHKARAAQ